MCSRIWNHNIFLKSSVHLLAFLHPNSILWTDIIKNEQNLLDSYNAKSAENWGYEWVCACVYQSSFVHIHISITGIFHLKIQSQMYMYIYIYIA